MVDETVELVAGDKRISALYELWYQAKCSVTQAYTDVLPEPPCGNLAPGFAAGRGGSRRQHRKTLSFFVARKMRDSDSLRISKEKKPDISGFFSLVTPTGIEPMITP